MSFGVLPWLDTAEKRIARLYCTDSTLDTIQGQIIRLLVSGLVSCCIGGAIGLIMYILVHYTGEISQRSLEFFAPIGVLFPLFWKDYGPD